MLTVKVMKLHQDAVIPAFATAGAAGFDLRAIDAGSVTPGLVARIRTGLAFEVPEGHAMLLVGRSGLGSRFGAGVPQGFGLLDSDYRGEAIILLRCEQAFAWEAGDRIAQAMIVPVPAVQLVEAETLGVTGRGSGGFGSTGAA